MEEFNKKSGESQKGGYDRIDRWDEKTTSELVSHYSDILNLLGEDDQREGLKDTPQRVAKAMQFLTHGYAEAHRRSGGGRSHAPLHDDAGGAKAAFGYNHFRLYRGLHEFRKNP